MFSAWQIAVVLNPDNDDRYMDQLVRRMPVWAIDTPSYQELAPRLREAADSFWYPEPAFTLFKSQIAAGKVAECMDILGMIELHHPGIARLELVGIQSSELLTVSLSNLGYEPATQNSEHSITFKKQLTLVPKVADLILDATSWKTRDDVYDCFFRAVGAPSWHGRNFDALEDSIITGSINKIEIPYRLIVRNLNSASSEAKKFADQFFDLFDEFASKGYPVNVTILD
jgi:RNAse (barnase) inhibitor barstar